MEIPVRFTISKRFPFQDYPRISDSLQKTKRIFMGFGWVYVMSTVGCWILTRPDHNDNDTMMKTEYPLMPNYYTAPFPIRFIYLGRIFFKKFFNWKTWCLFVIHGKLCSVFHDSSFGWKPNDAHCVNVVSNLCFLMSKIKPSLLFVK